jgi:hypothetical protein
VLFRQAAWVWAACWCAYLPSWAGCFRVECWVSVVPSTLRVSCAAISGAWWAASCHCPRDLAVKFRALVASVQSGLIRRVFWRILGRLYFGILEFGAFWAFWPKFGAKHVRYSAQSQLAGPWANVAYTPSASHFGWLMPRSPVQVGAAAPTQRKVVRWRLA